MLKQCTRNEFDRAITMIPDHENKLRTDRNFHDFYFQKFFYSKTGELLAMHDQNGSYWVSPTLVKSTEQFPPPHEIQEAHLEKMKRPRSEIALQAAALRRGITVKELEEQDNQAYRAELKKELKRLKNENH